MLNTNISIKKVFGDLHTHSSASDGDLSPSQVVIEAKRLNLRALALTDHDTLGGLLEAVLEGKKLDIPIIPGIEISLRYNRQNFVGTIHYLVYFSETLLKHTDFTSEISNLLSQGRGHSLVETRVNTINSLFGPNGSLDRILKYPLTVEEIQTQGQNITRRHFQLVLTNIHGLDEKTASYLINNQSPAYIPSGIDINLLKSLFERFHLLQILAHPAAGSFPGPSVYKEVLPPFEIIKNLIPELLEFGLDGLEVYHPGHTIEHVNALKQLAQKYNLLLTGGSDFHDLHKRPMGIAGVNENEFNIFLERLKKQH